MTPSALPRARRSLAAPSAALALLGASAVAGVAPGPAGAVPRTVADPLPPGGEVISTSSPDDLVLVEEVTAAGAVVSSATYDGEGNRVVILPDGTLMRSAADGSGSGGSSSASGCRKVTVRNVGESVLGKVVYRYNTWTQWCWNRSDRAITSVKTGVYYTDVASTMYMRGPVVQNETFYAWRAGYNKSGHWHERQSHWENCLVRYGCISSDYPRNVLRAHSDGTYTWATQG